MNQDKQVEISSGTFVNSNNPSSLSLKRILIVTSVPAEQEAVIRGLNGAEGFDVLVGGVGAVFAAASTARTLATTKYDVVICAGIAGGFIGKADVASVVVANEMIAADLGAETPEGFLSLDELGFGSVRIPVDITLTKRVTEALKVSGLPTHTGSILTVSTVTGSAETAAAIASRVVGATAEAMEGYGVATAAQQFEIPVLEIRTISNPVGPRDRSAWRIKEALEALEKVSSVLVEVLR
ncbi:futalosine hydrolase [Brevibacillus laterosporus]|uniref:Futalosine hydrolase n=1 Tax=Brevibacillus laterosporus TaxID=1465 RepID=A0AAP3DL29_BRELA|nr:futalosine hydrolase [Brevibacillus laterosporus]MCR8983288.1 futalosine hydrolase [Brevibacillus laterosporus]MCZ0810444.1 futalosine hydrolase [Brevibacillus laterosporus]MCZ0829016.1 futalosine hydrolase [Brevibacillus laterosporus]MCZ0851854.1 futalosine hydrolase [Brevibacillus laterosporus]